MARNLVVVESPAKAKTIGKYLGKDYTVVASMGHVRDLPKSDFAVEIADGVGVTYEVTPRGKKAIAEIRKAAKGAQQVFLATDPDREGEAIAWHIAQAAKLTAEQVRRVAFTEITAEAVRRAFAEPRQIDERLVDAQQARRVVDRIVGYKLSPVLWRKVRAGLSAGRVQSAALRMIVDREREIQAFKPQEYWSLEADLQTERGEPLHARYPVGEKQKFALGDEGAAQAAAEAARAADWVVQDITKSERRRSAAPPFITSTLQQEASRKLGFSSKRTMAMAQQLYEGVELPGEGSVGLITYMRTDSPALSQAALDEIGRLVRERYGDRYHKRSQYRAKAKNAQEAHEAIRPTDVTRTPESLASVLDHDQLRLYELIWKRAVASQMAPAVYDQTSVDISAGDLVFRATGSVLRFDGFERVYREGRDDEAEEEQGGTLPDLEVGQRLRLVELVPVQHFTEPPPRYTEASLVKALEEHGIGRPSTYAPTISTLLERKYVRLERKRFHPEDVGIVVTDLLSDVFPKVVDLGFTAEMEEDLDRIASGERAWEPVVKSFFAEVEGTISEREDKISRPEEATDEPCPSCGAETGAKLVRKWGRYGWFLSCSRYPDCKYRRSAKQTAEQAEKAEPELTDEPCPKCGKPMVRRTGRFGPFLGCSEYPRCRGIKNLGERAYGTCPRCEQGQIVSKRTRRGKTFYGCNRYPDCDFALWQAPLEQPCPACGSLLTPDKDGETATCARCGHQVPVAELATASA